MNLHTLHAHTLSLPSPTLHMIRSRRSRTITLPRRFLPIHRPQNSNFKFTRNSTGQDKLLEAGEGELLMQNCISRTLPPALTLEHGLDELKDAVEDLKLNPPPSTTGIYRFQVLVSPSAKAFDWFCCQPESSGIFPQFFISNKNENSTSMSPSLDRMRGVFGIGAAVCFKGPYSCASADYVSFKRLQLFIFKR